MATSTQSNQTAGTGDQAATSNNTPDPSLGETDQWEDAVLATDKEAARAVRILLYITRKRDANNDEHWLPFDATPTMYAATALVAASFFGADKTEPIEVEVNRKLEQTKLSWTSTRSQWIKTLKDLETRGLPNQNLSDERLEEGFRLAKRLVARVPQYSDEDKAIPLPRPDPVTNTPAAKGSKTPTTGSQTQAVGEGTAPAPAANTSVLAANTSAVTSSEVDPSVIPDRHAATTTPNTDAVDDLPAQTTAPVQETPALDPNDERPASTVRSEPPQTPRQKGHESRASTSAFSTGSSGRRRFAGNVGYGSLIGAFPQSPTQTAFDSPRPPRETDPGPQKLAELKLLQQGRSPVNSQSTPSKGQQTSNAFSKPPTHLTDPYLPGNFPQARDEVTKRTASSSPELDKAKTIEKNQNAKIKDKKSDDTEKRNDEDNIRQDSDTRQKGKQKAHEPKDTSSAWHGPLPLSRAPKPAATAHNSEGESSQKARKRKSDEELRNELLQEQALKRRGRDWEAISRRLKKKP